jgi:drug/metabolite transporter (DMT)-like permease
VQPENERLGLIYGTLSALLFFGMAIATQALPHTISASQISTFRGLFTAICLLPLAAPHLKNLINLKLTRSIWIRSLSGGVAVICFFYNLAHISAADAKALSNTNPLYVAIFAYFLYRESLSPREFTGLVVLLYGAFLLSWNMTQGDSLDQWIVGNIGSFFTAIAYLSLKRASGKFPMHFIVFTFGIAVALVSVASPGSWAWPTPSQWFWLTVVGLCGLGGQIFLTYSYIHLKNTIASALTLIQSLMLISYDIFWTGRLKIDNGLWGNLLILAGMLMMIFWKKRAH